MFDPKNSEHLSMLKNWLVEQGIDPSASAANRETATAIKNAIAGCNLEKIADVAAAALEEFRSRRPAPKTSFQPELASNEEPNSFFILIYGEAGIGKSTLASYAPNPFFIDIENGLKYIKTTKTKPITSLDKFYQNVDYFWTSPYETLVIDSFTRLEKLFWEKIMLDNNLAAMESMGFQKAYSIAYDMIRRLIDTLQFNVTKYKKNVILISHLAVKTAPNPTGEAYEKYTINVHKLVSDYLWAQLDAILFAFLDQYIKKNENDEYISKSKGKTKIITGFNNSCICKNRFGLPNEMDMTPKLFELITKGTVQNG